MTVSFSVPRAAYIHVPFCAHRCGYCDFTLVAGKDHLIGDYLRALEIELSSLERVQEIDTLFLGGGTPTHLSATQLQQLLDIVQPWFHLTDGYEFSVEANPAGLDRDKVAVLADGGVNRISLGVQSFDDDVLEFLERDHRRQEIQQAIELLQSYFDNIALDIICGVPGQTLALWRETLKRAITLGPQHISTYGLTIEKGTSFWSRRQKSQIVSLSEEVERDMLAAAMDELPLAGWEQYEISNFAKPGYRCRHNEVYWSGLSHFGFGPGAVRYIDGRRIANHRSVTTWIKRVLAGEPSRGDSEQLSPEDRAREALVIGLRRCDGVERIEFLKLTGFELFDLAAEAINKLQTTGLIECSASRIQLTREGRFLADTVAGELL